MRLVGALDFIFELAADASFTDPAGDDMKTYQDTGPLLQCYPEDAGSRGTSSSRGCARSRAYGWIPQGWANDVQEHVFAGYDWNGLVNRR